MSNIVQIHRHQLALTGALQDASLQVRLENFGKQSKNIELQDWLYHNLILAARERIGKAKRCNPTGFQLC